MQVRTDTNPMVIFSYCKLTYNFNGKINKFRPQDSNKNFKYTFNKAPMK